MDLEYNQGVLFVRLKGALFKKGSMKLNNYLVPVILKYKIKNLVYNFSELIDIDEMGINAILNTKCAIKVNKGKIVLCEVPYSFNQDIRKLKIKETLNELTALNLINV